MQSKLVVGAFGSVMSGGGDMAHRIITCDFRTGLDTQNMGIPKSLSLTHSDQ